MKNPLGQLHRFIDAKIWDLESVLFSFAQTYTHKRNEKIRVVFMVQYLPAWNKTSPVYERLAGDSRFEVFLLCIPGEIANNRLDASVKTNHTYAYFVQKGYPGVIDALSADRTWFDLKSINPDYVFYSRPYNNYLPVEYSSRNVSKIAKICLVLYGMNLSKATLGTSINWRFCSGIRIFFSESAFVTEYFKRQYHVKTTLKLQSAVTTGAPVLEAVMAKKEEPAAAWNFTDSSFRILWTPRWSTDQTLGGSNFFKYKDSLIDFADKNRELAFLFRPHPLAFGNFLRTGEMTRQEILAFKDTCKAASNISLDETADYIETFWQSSVLLSDYSSILPEYFITGKPIIFCEADIDWKLEPFARKMFDTFYIAECEDDIKKYILELRKGNDYLIEKRRQTIAELFGEDFSAPSKRIAAYLLADYGAGRSIKNHGDTVEKSH